MKIAVYPGSFDPITNGHLDILDRAIPLFDKIIILVAVNENKKSIFSPEERVKMIKEGTKHLNNVEVDFYNGLTVSYAKAHGATYLIRGLREMTDFEYELQLYKANEFIDSSIDCLYFMSRSTNSFISSSSIHEMKKNKIDVSNLVPNSVIEMYKEKFNL